MPPSQPAPPGQGSVHRNTRSFAADLAAALLCAVLGALGLAGWLPGGLLATAATTAALLGWIGTQPLRATVRPDGALVFATPFATRTAEHGMPLRTRWLRRPYRADGVLLLILRGWPVLYRPQDYERPRRLADAVARLLAGVSAGTAPSASR